MFNQAVILNLHVCENHNNNLSERDIFFNRFYNPFNIDFAE